MRAVSTVLDVVVFLLLVGGAVTVLVGTGPTPPRATSAHGTADVLATSTATVTYTPGGTATAGSERSAEGTLAELLAAAAVANATLDGTELTASSDPFERAVSETITASVARETVGTRVSAVWRAYPGGPLRGTVTAGPTPPANAEVHAATLTVPSGLAPATDDGSLDAVGKDLAASVVAGLFPPRRTRMALAADGGVATETRSRYRTVAATLGANINGSLTANDASTANEVLRAKLATELQDDLDQRYGTATAATEDTRVDTVRITVRTWSA